MTILCDPNVLLLSLTFPISGRQPQALFDWRRAWAPRRSTARNVRWGRHRCLSKRWSYRKSQWRNKSHRARRDNVKALSSAQDFLEPYSFEAELYNPYSAWSHLKIRRVRYHQDEVWYVWDCINKYFRLSLNGCAHIGEGTAYTKLNSNAELRFPLTGKISQAYQKVR